MRKQRLLVQISHDLEASEGKNINIGSQQDTGLIIPQPLEFTIPVMTFIDPSTNWD
jgi:hypothetical protein